MKYLILNPISKNKLKLSICTKKIPSKVYKLSSFLMYLYKIRNKKRKDEYVR